MLGQKGGETTSVQCEQESCFGSSNDGSPVALPVTLGGMEMRSAVSNSPGAYVTSVGGFSQIWKRSWASGTGSRRSS